jgi:DNA-binding NtrC family response regulator
MSFTMGGIYLMVDSRDRFWIAPFQDGVYCYDSSDAAWEAAGGDESSRPRHFGVSDSLADKNYVAPLLEMEDGTFWFRLAAASQLSRFNPEQIPDVEPLEFINTNGPVSCLIEDKLGRLWMGGMNHSGLSCWDGSELNTYTEADGLPSSSILSLVEGDSGGIWIGTNHGLCYFDGQKFITYGKEHGLRELFYWQSIKDASGQLWFATRGGIIRTDGRHFQWLTEDDGLPSNNVSGVFPQSDGSMIIWTKYGAVRYQPTAVLPPRVEIRGVVADKVYQISDEIELTTTAASLVTISYHGLSLATKRMRYSYILEGHDEKWQDTWERKVRYENLPVGEYTFKVIAINRDLVESKAPAILRLTVVPDPRDVSLNVLQNEVGYLRREAGMKYDFEKIIGQSDGIRQVRALMERAIDSGLTVLIIGETGTGKELVAKAIHYNSPRKDGPIRDLNCGATQKELVASKLFGHIKGAFTGATADKIGLFEAASGGTLLLDEIGEMPQDEQIHLFRVLEEHAIQRVGDHASRDVDVRIIAMTNIDLLEAAKNGKFRKELYYRLSIFPIYVPTLRERTDDIPLLADHFLQKACEQQGKELKGFAPEVMDMLKAYSWPGNIRELEHEIYRAVALADDDSYIQTYHFSPTITQGESIIQEVLSEQLGLSASLKLLRQRMIENALRETNGNRTQAAKRLKMDTANLRKLIRNLDIEA